MTVSKRIKKTAEGLFPVFTAVVNFLIQTYGGIVYTETDNFTTAIIVNGYFADNSYCHILNPFLCLVLGKLSHIFEKADIFASATQIFMFFAFMWLAFLYTRKSRRVLDYGLVFFGLLCMTLLLRIWSVNYLVQAAFFAMTGLASLFFSLEFLSDKTGSIGKLRWFLIPVGIVFYSFGMMLRSDAAKLFLPFVLLFITSGFFRRFRSKEKLFQFGKNALFTFFPLLIVILLLNWFRGDFYGKEPYLSAMRFNGTRSSAGDYPMKSWEELTSADGFTRTEYNAAIMWQLSDTDTMTAEKLSAINKAGREDKHDKDSQGFTGAVKEMMEFIQSTGARIVVPILFVLFIFIGELFCADSRVGKMEAASAVLGGFFIILHYTMKGRAPLRVWLAVIFATILVLSFIPVIKNSEKRNLVIALKCSALIVAAVTSCDVLLGVQFHQAITPFDSRVGADETKFSDTMRDNIICVWGGWSTEGDEEKHITNYLGGWYENVVEHFIYQGKLPSRDFFKHNIPVGEWFYGQVFFNEHLKEIDAQNPMRALLDREDVFFVNGNGVEEYRDFYLEYMIEHFGQVYMIDAGEIGSEENKVWKVRRKE